MLFFVQQNLRKAPEIAPSIQAQWWQEMNEKLLNIKIYFIL